MTDKTGHQAATHCTPLLAQAIADPVLLKAWEHVQKNNGRPGVDGISVAQFGKKLFYHLGQLRLQLQTGVYTPGPVREGSLDKQDGKPARRYCVLNLADRILQTAVIDVLRPLVEPVFHNGSFAYRQGRSTRMALEAVAKLRDDGYTWVFYADIADFFDSIDHTIMRHKLQAVCSDAGLLALVSAWLQAPIQQADKSLLVPERGLAQGSPLSPLLANLYLNELDWQLEGTGQRIVRYADDFLLLCRTQQQLKAASTQTEQQLAPLKLRLNQAKTRLTSFDEGFVFLGMQFQQQQMTPAKPQTGACLLPAPAQAFKVHAGHETPTAYRLQTTPPLKTAALTEMADDASPQEAEAAQTETADIKHLLDDQAPPHLRTLYLLTPGLLLGRSNDRLTVSSKKNLLNEVPIQTIDQVLTLGACSISSQSLTLCTEHGIGFHVIDARHKVISSLANVAAESVALRRCQYQTHFDPARCLALAQQIVNAKIHNSRHIMARFVRHHPLDKAEDGLTQLQALQKSARLALSLDELRGYEGASARVYFDLLRSILPPEWLFGARIAHPPLDPVNALLSYGYAVLYGNTATLIQRRGLDPAFGFLHALKEGHLTLASDLMEAYRAPVVDAVVLSLIFRHRIRPDDFVMDEDEALPCLMNNSTKRTVLHALEEKLNSAPADRQQDYRRLMAQDISLLAHSLEDKVSPWSPLMI